MDKFFEKTAPRSMLAVAIASCLLMTSTDAAFAADSEVRVRDMVSGSRASVPKPSSKETSAPVTLVKNNYYVSAGPFGVPSYGYAY